jgi:LPS-assembly lipoprotein
MWSPDPRALRFALRLAVTGAAAATVAGCFQPMYGDVSLTTSPSVAANMAAVDVNQIAAPNGTPLSRIAVDVRDRLLFGLTGGHAAAPPVYRLNIQINGSSESMIVDINSGRPDTVDYALNANYTLFEVKRASRCSTARPSRASLTTFPARRSASPATAACAMPRTARRS